MAKQKTKLTFGTGCAINRDMFYLSSTLDELEATEDTPVSRMVFYQHQTADKWFYHDLPAWRVVSTCYPNPAPNSVRKIYALSEQGDVESYSRDGSVIEKIADAGLEPVSPNYGYVTRIREIDGHLYVCGYGGQVYKRDSAGWAHVDAQLLQKKVDIGSIEDPSELLAALTKSADETIGLIDINGLDEKSIYVVGNDGYMAFFDGTSWTKLPKATAAHLNCVMPVSADSVWVAGSKGTLLKGNFQTGFSAVARKSLSTDFYSLAWFNDRLFIGAGDGIYELDENGPQRLMVSDKFSLDGVSTVEAKDGVLWVLASRRLARYDGAQWEVFENPHNSP
ncbi:WD40/YVTN/BNR-like repeat-containing protein [Burkholderia vietnamiensis]|uniref:WD40/YVTN/BNR-like repeat-containing protein n=1 Tax=Burkholderia vietnamiensis TaxID=60552 RepID=UPI00265692CE|nr:hypothetical protein [Burkholderia vietnamiensis]MDN8039286.1 hypothetical protein [Burkholderia vietnamiensis]